MLISYYDTYGGIIRVEKEVLDDIDYDTTPETLKPAPVREIAVPWILGLYGLAGATFVVGGHMAHWFGGARSDLFLFPFAAVLGGIATFLAGMWAFRTRDGVATAMLGTWGSFWTAYGLLNLLVASGRLTVPAGVFPAMGFWFIALASISWMGAIAAAAESTALVTVFGFLAAASTLSAITELVGATILGIIAGWLFIIAAVAAWYAASAMMFLDAFGRQVLPLGSIEPARTMWTRRLGATRAPQTHSAHRVA
jgi:uncharacterized protein